MMWFTEITIITSTGEEQTHEGPVVTANTFEEAQENAIEMNAELRVIGEYIDSVGNGYGMGIYKL